MEKTGIHRKRIPIPGFNAAVYSRPMHGDEAATAKTLKTYQQVIPELIENPFQVSRMAEGLPQRLVFPHQADITITQIVKENRDIEA